MTSFTNDILSEALGLMRVTGSLVFTEAVAPPWGVSVPGQAELASLLLTDDNTRVIAFHYVQRGGLDFQDTDGEAKTLAAGELLVCFGGKPHRLSQGQLSAPIALEAYLKGAPNPFRPVGAAEAHSTALVCGIFLLHNTHLNPLFAALPSVLHLQHAEAENAGAYPTVAHLLVDEVHRPAYGSAYTLHRLLELLCVAAIRTHLATVDETGRGWFRGLKDPLLGQALYRFHCNPGEAWSVGKLADEVHLSPSRFAARFAETLGESSMAYVTRWRMNLARHLLYSTDLSTQEIAFRVGYRNLPAFSRTYKRYLGVSPAGWRALYRDAAQ